jgi:hypothetical protein
MSSKKTPHSLGEWQQHLQRLVLPIDPSIKSAVLQKLHTRTANANNVAAIIKHDPALSLLLMVEANKSLSLSGTETTSLSHTVSLLGFPQTEQIIRRIPDYNSNPFPRLREYRQQLIISLHAAHQAQAWAKFSPYWQQHDLFWPTLFHRAPIWALWYQAGDQMLELDYRRAERNGANHHSDEKQLLGCTIQTIATALSRRWHLPQLSQHSWQTRLCGNARQWISLSKILPEQAPVALEEQPHLHQLCSRSEFAITLANKLADEAEWDWYSKRALRIQKIAATALHLPLSANIALNHQQAAISSHLLSMPNNLSPGKQLISYYRKADDLQSQSGSRPSPIIETQPQAAEPVIEPPQPAKPKQAPPIKKQAPKLSRPKKPSNSSAALNALPSEYDEVIERILQRPDSFKSVDELIQLALDTLCEELNFERAAASFYREPDKELLNRLSCGAEDSPALKNFHYTLKQGDIFTKLLAKPLSMRLQPSNYSKIWPILPGNFKQACGADEFFMMSVFSNTHPVVIIYADHGNTNTAMSDEQYQQFKQLCRSLTLSLPSLT